tara:strand:+ start:147 stop:284 length:138 start_codon:yes stop_codon:yes gene_type:complete
LLIERYQTENWLRLELIKIENIKSKHAISLAHWLVAFSMVEVRKT